MAFITFVLVMMIMFALSRNAFALLFHNPLFLVVLMLTCVWSITAFILASTLKEEKKHTFLEIKKFVTPISWCVVLTLGVVLILLNIDVITVL